jgi:hypothetical protein
MAAGQITLRGRFSPGSQVRLVRVDGEHVLRAEGGEEVATKKVDDDGCVEFTTGVDVNARYFIVGQHQGFPLEVRARGRAKDDPSEVLENAPTPRERVRLSDGSWADEAPEQHRKATYAEGAPHLAQTDVPKGTPQRSDTPRGSAHPLDPEEPTPYPSQEEERFTKGKVPQMSDTPLGMATPIDLGIAQRQEDVKKGTPQRSDTPTGVATPIPQDGPVAAQEEKEASETKAKRGEPVKAAAAPLGDTVPTGKTSDEREQKVVEERREALAQPAVQAGAPSDRDDTSGLNALGHPITEEQATSTGVEPAKRPAEAKSTRKATASKPRRKATAKKSSSSKSSSSKSKTSGSQSSGNPTSKEK